MAKKNFEIEDNRISMDHTLSEMINPFQKSDRVEPSIEKTQSKNKSGKKVMVAMRIEPEKWEDLKVIARVDAISLSAVLDRLIEKEIQNRRSEIDKLNNLKNSK